MKLAYRPVSLRAWHLARDLDFNRDFDIDRALDPDITIKLCEGLGLIVYLQQWDEKDEQLLKAIKWDKAQLDAYTQYLKGTALLIDCLQLAAVSDRAGIEERLLLPASQN